MKRFLTLCLIVFGVFCSLHGCGAADGEGRELARIGRELGLDLSAGTLERFEDSHGGFLGDGLTLAEVAAGGLGEGAAGVPGWRPLPMTEGAARAWERCGGADGAVKEGFYYLYDRSSESTDPFDDSELHQRHSWNFTMAVYDSENGRLYYYKLDT